MAVLRGFSVADLVALWLWFVRVARELDGCCLCPSELEGQTLTRALSAGGSKQQCGTSPKHSTQANVAERVENATATLRQPNPSERVMELPTRGRARCPSDNGACKHGQRTSFASDHCSLARHEATSRPPLETRDRQQTSALPANAARVLLNGRKTLAIELKRMPHQSHTCPRYLQSPFTSANEVRERAPSDARVLDDADHFSSNRFEIYPETDNCLRWYEV